jgi:basic membrane lipoprotein Med (substrate-binding protein (PBP1-ABC) superfamily)
MVERKAILAAAILMAAAVLALSPCCSRGGPAASGPSRLVAAAFEGEGPLRDGVLAAFDRIAAERGGRVLAEASAPEPSRRIGGLDARSVVSKVGGDDGERILRILADERPDLVIVAGPRLAGSASRVALDYPRIKFALVGVGSSFSDASPNLASISFELAEGAFLAGAIAGCSIAPGGAERLGFIAAADGPESNAIEAAFRAGAATASPELRKGGRVLSYYCGRYSPPDPEIARAAELALAKKKAASVFRCGFGGADALYRGDVAIARVEGRADAVAYGLVEELFATGSVRGGHRSMGLAEGAVECSPTKEGSEALGTGGALVAGLRARIAKGELDVPSDDDAAAEYIRALK